MNPEALGESDPLVPVIIVPEVRDYVRINAELVALLDSGHPRIRLDGAEGQRLLASGLVGPWRATIEIQGRTGPELAANIDAPGLRIVARGDTQDGAGRGLKAGIIVVVGDVGDGVGYAQSGGTLVVTGDAGHRAGLGQSGGILAVLGKSGRLAGDRQSGGTFFLGRGGVGPYPGLGRRGGRRVGWFDPWDDQDRTAWNDLVEAVSPWVDPSILERQ